MTVLHPAMLMIYRHASEIVHGTYFGALFLWGATGPQPRATNADELRVILGEHQFAILAGVVFANAALLECAGQYCDLTDMSDGSEDLVQQMNALPVIKEGLAASP